MPTSMCGWGVCQLLQPYICRPYTSGNTESCRPAPPSAGAYFVMLRGYTSFTNTSLMGRYDEAPPPGTGATAPFVEAGLSGAQASTRQWMVIPGSGRRLSVTISGGTGDADLYTRFGAPPTTSSYTCRPYLNGNNETCIVNNTQAGNYYIMLRGYSAYSGVTLKVDF